MPRLAFAGFHHGYMHVPTVEIGTQWLCAYLRGDLDLPTLAEMERSIEYIRIGSGNTSNLKTHALARSARASNNILTFCSRNWVYRPIESCPTSLQKSSADTKPPTTVEYLKSTSARKQSELCRFIPCHSTPNQSVQGHPKRPCIVSGQKQRDRGWNSQ